MSAPGRLRRFVVRTAAVAAKEATHVVRDPRTLYLALGMPVVLLVIFGYGISFDVDDVPIAVVDQDRTPDSRALERALASGREFVIAARADDPAEVDRLFRDRTAAAALVVPHGFAADWAAGRAASVQLLVDGSDGVGAQSVLGNGAAALRAEAVRRLAAQTGGAPSPLAAEVRLLFNPALRSAVFFVPGLIAYILYIVGVLLTALTIAREQERGNLEQLFATPVGRLEVMLGKLLPYLALGLLQALLVLAFGMAVFEVPLRGSLVVLGLGTLLFLAGALAQGLFISSVAGSQQVATQAGALSSLLPGILLSGFVFPVENMPAVLQWVASIFPARYYVDLLRGVMLRGNGFDVLWTDFLGLGVFCVAAVALATLRFKRRLA
jgi:ABC-2 type transport system permease protein